MMGADGYGKSHHNVSQAIHADPHSLQAKGTTQLFRRCGAQNMSLMWTLGVNYTLQGLQSACS